MNRSPGSFHKAFRALLAAWLAVLALAVVGPAAVWAQEEPATTDEPGLPPGDSIEEQLGIESRKPIEYTSIHLRDPFKSLIGEKGTGELEDRPEGIRGMNINEIDLEGIMFFQGGYRALVAGNDDKSYQLRVGDELYDGRVTDIGEDRVVFEQRQYDVLGRERPPKEVILELRPAGE